METTTREFRTGDIVKVMQGYGENIGKVGVLTVTGTSV